MTLIEAEGLDNVGANIKGILPITNSMARYPPRSDLKHAPVAILINLSA